MRFRAASYLTLWLCLPAAHVAAQGVQVGSTPYPTVTDERLQHPEAGDWLMYRRTYDGWGFSPLKQITSSNSHNLSLAWSLSTDLRVGRQEIALGSGRMYALREGPNVLLSFDGVRAIAHAGRWRLDAWVARPVDTTEFPSSTAARDRHPRRSNSCHTT
jgi:Alginate export